MYEEIKDKETLLKKYASDYITLKNIIEPLDDNVIKYIPDIKDAWSILEHIGHMVDTEVNGYIRFKRAILNPGTTIDLGIGNIDRSNSILDYASQNLNDLMDLFRLIRKLLFDHANRLKHDDFDHYYIEHVNHPVFKRCTLGFVLSLTTQHFDKHLEYIKRNIDIYNKQ